jgi:hypothetical protein
MAEEDQARASAVPPGLAGWEAGLAELAEAFSGPLLWPEVPAGEAEAAWGELREWVEAAMVRFSWDTHLLPSCWFRHNHLVEALSALRDHERGSYAPTAPSTAGVEFHRALRDIEARLRAWCAELRCEAAHDASHDRPRKLPEGGFSAFVANDLQARRERG